MVKGGEPRVRVKGTKDEGMVVFQEDIYDARISKYFPVKHYTVELDNGVTMQYINAELIWL